MPCSTLPRIDLNRNRNMTTERDVMTEVVEKDSPVTDVMDGVTGTLCHRGGSKDKDVFKK